MVNGQRIMIGKWHHLLAKLALAIRHHTKRTAKAIHMIQIRLRNVPVNGWLRNFACPERFQMICWN